MIRRSRSIRYLDPLISFDGTEETAVEIGMSVEWGREGQRIMLDIANPLIRELVTNKDERLFELLAELVPLGEQEIENALEDDRREIEEANREAELDRLTVKVPRIIPGYVYLIKSGEGCYKIGCSTNVQRRMRDFGGQLPYPIELLHVIPAKNMYRSEESLHAQYSHCRFNGEWFSLTIEEVETICTIKEL